MCQDVWEFTFPKELYEGYITTLVSFLAEKQQASWGEILQHMRSKYFHIEALAVRSLLAQLVEVNYIHRTTDLRVEEYVLFGSTQVKSAQFS